ncbi:hypothetical protein Fmac_029597 [Flemingia macrophylla]|uniref:Uncharacterized protein n=1 Tax=Flemingia macrophylla TaxID=520843 RepID=A0ABD1LBD7_9FABA
MSNRPSDTQFSLQRFANYRQQRISNNDPNAVKNEERTVGPNHSQGTSHAAAKIEEEKLETSKIKLHQLYQAHERGRRSTVYFEGHERKIPKDENRSSRLRYSNRSGRS